MHIQPVTFQSTTPAQVPNSSAGPLDSVTLGGTPAPEVGHAAVARLFGTAAPKDPHVFWEAPLDDMVKNPRGGGFLPAQPVLAADGACYVGTNRGELIAFGPDGAVQWRRDLGEPSPYHDPVLAYDGSLVLTNEHDRRLLRLGADNEVIYDVQLPEPARSRPAVDVDGRVYVVGETGLHAVDADGKHAWSCPLAVKFMGHFVHPDGSVLTYGRNPSMDDPVVLRCYGRDGSTLWDYTFEGETRALPVTGRNGETIVADGARLRFLDTGGRVAKDLDLGAPLGELATDADGRIFVTAGDRLIALDDQGKTLWQTSCPVRERQTLTVAGDGTVYAATREGRLHAYRGSDGQHRWTADLGQPGPHCRVIPAPDGTVFVDFVKSVQILDASGRKRGLLEGRYFTAAPEALLAGRIAVSDLERVRMVGPADWTEGLETEQGRDPRLPGSIERVGDWVIINGVKVPVRKSGPL